MLHLTLAPLASSHPRASQSGVEPTFCMGDDIPLSVLSDKPHPLYNYFKQRFAQVGGLPDMGRPKCHLPVTHSTRCCLLQVTNPPIDPLREGLVMSMEMRLGGRGNLLQPGSSTYRQVLTGRVLPCGSRHTG